MREFDLLNHVFAANAALSDRVEVPPGDDMAVIRMGRSRLLAAVDQLVDGRHVQMSQTPLALVGRKAITRSLSDIAAMAAKPVATLVAVTLPPDFGEQRANVLFDAMRETAEQYDCPLIGGDIAFHDDPSHPLVCSVTVLAQPGSQPVVTRAGARPGDQVYVTGRLGGAYDDAAGGRHLTFEPRISEALDLSEQLSSRLHAMIDISDGLGRDAGHIASQSGVQLRLDASLIPCINNLTWQRALADGEDYELCFTASGPVPEQIRGVPVTLVGDVIMSVEGNPDVVVVDGDRIIDAREQGWQHES